MAVETVSSTQQQWWFVVVMTDAEFVCHAGDKRDRSFCGSGLQLLLASHWSLACRCPLSLAQDRRLLIDINDSV